MPRFANWTRRSIVTVSKLLHVSRTYANNLNRMFKCLCVEYLYNRILTTVSRQSDCHVEYQCVGDFRSDTGVGVCPAARYRGERIAGGRSSEGCEKPRREGDRALRFSTLDNCCRAETLVICFKLCGREIRDGGRLALLIVQKFQVNIVK